jgi:N-acetylglutamate synthase-like GNAT family acetyltransferase
MSFTEQPSTAPEIVSYTSRYQQQVIDLILSIQQTEFGVAVKLSDQPDLTMIPEFYQSGNGQFWIALVQDKVVGTIGLLDIGQNRGALRKMFVHAHYRGAGHRIGQALLDRLLRHATERALSEILLGTTEKFIAAHKFYEKNGFGQIAKNDLPPEFPVMAVDVKFYRLQLAGHRKQ